MTAHVREKGDAEEPRVSEVHPEVFHYTSISALRGMLETNTLWATRATHLNDSSEMKLIWSRLTGSFTEYLEIAIKDYIRDNPDAYTKLGGEQGAADVAALEGRDFVNRMRSILLGDDTTEGMAPPFVASFTTHSSDCPQDDYRRGNGMLSQWRGYGGDDGVAIVFDTEKLERVLDREDQIFHLWPCLVADVVYDEENLDMESRFRKLFDELNSLPRNFIKGLIEGNDREVLNTLENGVAKHLPLAVGRFKHAGFRDEQECRVVVGAMPESLRDQLRQPNENPERRFKKIHHRPGLCGSVPYIRLFEDIEEKLPITRILVGPSRNQKAHLETVCELVDQCRDIKVQVSKIPYVGSA